MALKELLDNLEKADMSLAERVHLTWYAWTHGYQTKLGALGSTVLVALFFGFIPLGVAAIMDILTESWTPFAIDAFLVGAAIIGMAVGAFVSSTWVALKAIDYAGLVYLSPLSKTVTSECEAIRRSLNVARPTYLRSESELSKIEQETAGLTRVIVIANRLVYELDSKFAKYKYPEVIARNLSNGVSYTYILPKNATNADEWSTLAQKIRKQLASLNRPVIGANGRGEFGVLFETEEYCALAASGVAVYILDNEEYPRGHLTFQYLPDYEENVMLDDGCSSGLHTGVDISAPIIQFVTSRSKKISKEVFG